MTRSAQRADVIIIAVGSAGRALGVHVGFGMDSMLDAKHDFVRDPHFWLSTSTLRCRG